MTPLPAPRPPDPGYITVRDPLQMSSSRYLAWRNRPRPKPMAPTWIGDTIAATAQLGEPTDEVDAGFLGAVRLSPRLIGPFDGLVPEAVARRLVNGGWVKRKPWVLGADNDDKPEEPPNA